MDKCRICNWEGEGEKYIVREMMQNTWDEFVYFICPSCNCLQIKEVPDNLEKYYGADYYSYTKPDTSVPEAVEKCETRVLDVGCGAGTWLCMLAKAGHVNLCGCDPFIEKDLEYENGVKIYKKTIHEMEGEFDVIFLKDSFEHVTDPHEVMESIKRLLAPGGTARIRLPVFPNVAFDVFKEHWYQIDAPRHICLHSKKSLAYLAEGHGLKIVGKEYDSNNSQFIRSFLYMNGIPWEEQTEETFSQYFTIDDLKKLDEQADTVNEKEYGDHAMFYLEAEDGKDVE